MTRRTLYSLAFLTSILLLGSGTSFAQDRLGGAYRGPQDNKATETASSEDSEDNQDQPDAAGPESGGGEEGDSGGFGEGGGGSEGGAAPPEGGGGESESGGGDGFGGGSSGSGGASAGPSSGGGSSGSGGGLGGTATSGSGGGRGRGGAGAQQAFQRVSWYFEHNRERFLYKVAEARDARVQPLRYSALELFGNMILDDREIAPVTAADREKIFDLLQKSARLGREAVVRDAAILALGKVGSDAAVDVLIERFKAEGRTALKQDILLALGNSRSDRALEILQLALKNRKLTSFALFGLGLTRDTEKAGAVALDYFKGAVKKRKSDEDALCSAAMALGALGYEDAVPALAKALKSKKVAKIVRVYCAHALGSIGGEKAMKSLFAALKKSDQEVERASALALGNFDDPAVLGVLAGKNGFGKPDPLVAGFSAVSMGKVMSRLSEDEWKKYPKELREAAVKPEKDKIKAQYANLALGIFKGFDRTVLRYYQEQFTGTKLDPDTKSALAMAAGVAGIDSFEPALVKLASSTAEDPQSRGYAAMSLAMVGQPAKAVETLRKVYKLSSDADVRRGTLLGLGLVGDRADVPFLISVIRGDDAEYTKGAAVVAIGMIGDSASVDALSKLLGLSDARTRGYALAALGYLGDKDSTPSAPKMFEHNNFRSEFHTLQVVMQNL